MSTTVRPFTESRPFSRGMPNSESACPVVSSVRISISRLPNPSNSSVPSPFTLDHVAPRGMHLEREQAPSALEVLPRGGQRVGAGVDRHEPDRLGGTAADRDERRRNGGERHRTQ